jgi:hypothetical protein
MRRECPKKVREPFHLNNRQDFKTTSKSAEEMAKGRGWTGIGNPTLGGIDLGY